MFEIPPFSTKRVDFILGQAASVEEVGKIRESLTPGIIDKLCEEQTAIENERAESFKVETGNKNYDSLMNFFVKKQLYSYLINKSGFRDNLQVDYAFAMIDYQVAKDNFLRALSSQEETGGVIHSFRPINRLQYSDKPAWILMTAPQLIKESGDFSLLNEIVPYFESDKAATVWEHILLTMRYLINDTGKYGLCRQHHADWNDGLEATAETGERESVMVTQQLCYGLLEIEELALEIGDYGVAKEARDAFEDFKKRLNEVA